MDVLVRAKPVGRKIFVIWAPVDREGAPFVIKSDDVFLVDSVRRADFDPVSAHDFLPFAKFVDYSAAFTIASL
ncbi:hypothetical protein D9M70_582150 [compost metagenome]